MNREIASWSNLLSSSPIVVAALQTSATAIGPLLAASQMVGTAAATSPGLGVVVHFKNGSGNLAQPFLAVNTTFSDGQIQAFGLFSFSGGNNSWNPVPQIGNRGNERGTPMFGMGLQNGQGGGTTGVDGAVSNSVVNISRAVQANLVGVADPGEWTVDSSVAAAGTPSASKAAGGANDRHLTRNVSISLANVGVGPSALITIVLRDGASGAGTVKRTWQVVVPGSASVNIDTADLNIFGTPATAMTLESIAALPANVSGVCSLGGYTTGATA